MLVNRSAVRRAVLAAMAKTHPGVLCTRVAGRYYSALERRVEALIYAAVHDAGVPANKQTFTGEVNDEATTGDVPE